MSVLWPPPANAATQRPDVAHRRLSRALPSRLAGGRHRRLRTPLRGCSRTAGERDRRRAIASSRSSSATAERRRDAVLRALGVPALAPARARGRREAASLPSIRRYARNRALRILPGLLGRARASRRSCLESARLVPPRRTRVVGAVHDPALLLRGRAARAGALGRERSRAVSSPAWSLVGRGHVLPAAATARAARRWPRGQGGSRRRRRSRPHSPPRACSPLVGVRRQARRDLRRSRARGPSFATRWHSVLDRSFLTHADLFAAGMLVAVLHVEHERRPLLAARRGCRAITNCVRRPRLPGCLRLVLALPAYVWRAGDGAALRRARGTRRHASRRRRGRWRVRAHARAATARRSGDDLLQRLPVELPATVFLDAGTGSRLHGRTRSGTWPVELRDRRRRSCSPGSTASPTCVVERPALHLRDRGARATAPPRVSSETHITPA